MASNLFTGATILAFDPRSQSVRVVRNGSLLVTGDKVAEIYEESQSADIPKEAETIDVTGKIITPGFIDTHRHGWQTAFKTLAANTTLAEYFQLYGEYVPALAENITAEDIYLGQLAGLYEALNAGVTSTVDHAHGHWSEAAVEAGIQASVDSGARVFWGYTIHQTPKGWPAQEQLAHYRKLVQEGKLKDGLVSLGVAYDAFAMGDDNLTNIVATQIKESGAAFLTAHCLGGPWGAYNSPTLVDKFGLLRTEMPVILSHACFITEEDANLLRQTNQYISTTPESEAHYGHGNPGAARCQDQAALGVDTHFTFSTDMLTQARLWLQHLRQDHFLPTLKQDKVPNQSPMQVEQVYLMATRAGGLALRRPDLGVITKGSTADLCFFDGDSPTLLGWHDPVAAVILHAHVGDISDVMVGGKFVKRDGKITAPSYGEIKEKFVRSARKLQAAWIKMGKPELKIGDKFLGIKDYGTVETVVTERKGS